MQANIGSTDKAVRIVAGLALLSLVFLLKGNVRWFGLIGLVPMATAFMQFCPLYTLLGVNTGPKR
ncbi:MAG TPA: DUF2892 domain-containing protein [Geothrix sp.]|jgi:hypothetical protein